MANEQNKAAAIALSPYAIAGLINSLTAQAQTTGAPNEAKHAWARSSVMGLISLAAIAAPVVEAANPQYAVAIDAAIKGSVALYNMFGWPHETQPTPTPTPTPVPAPTPAPTPTPIPTPGPVDPSGEPTPTDPV